MSKYVLAIDEFGRFAFGREKSFACGVVVEANELTLKETYKKCIKTLGFRSLFQTIQKDCCKQKMM